MASLYLFHSLTQALFLTLRYKVWACAISGVEKCVAFLASLSDY